MTTIRPASRADAAPICTIYNYYVDATTISFEEALVDAAEMAGRIDEVLAAGLPWLVLVDDGAIIGYAYASKWRARSGYRYSTESSVYLVPECAGHGHGLRLYSRLLDELRQCQRHTVMAGIALPNERSIRLHEHLGFTKVAHFAEVGFKLGQWVDVGYWQLHLTTPGHA